MAQQVGSTSGTAPAARETEVTPGGESGMTEAGRPEGRRGQAGARRPRRRGRPGRRPTADRRPGQSGPRRGWLRRTPPAAAVPAALGRRAWWRPGPTSTWPRTTRWSATCSARPARWTSPGWSSQSPALAALRAGRRGPGRPAHLLGHPDRPAQPRAAPVRARLLGRRPAAAQLAGRLRRPGHAGRPAGPPAAGRSPAAGADRAGAEGRAAHPAAVPAEEPARPAELARGRLLPPGPHRRRRLLRLHPAAGRPGHVRGRRRHRQGRSGRAGHGQHARAAAGRGAAAHLARRGPRPRQRHALRGHPGAHVRHLPGAGARPGQRPGGFRQRRPRRPVCAHPKRRGRTARPRHAAGADARHGLRGEDASSSSRATAPCCTATGWPRRTRRTGRCSASRGCRRWSARVPRARP